MCTHRSKIIYEKNAFTSEMVLFCFILLFILFFRIVKYDYLFCIRHILFDSMVFGIVFKWMDQFFLFKKKKTETTIIERNTLCLFGLLLLDIFNLICVNQIKYDIFPLVRAIFHRQRLVFQAFFTVSSLPRSRFLLLQSSLTALRKTLVFLFAFARRK